MKLVTLLCLSMNKVICHTLNPIDDNQEGKLVELADRLRHQ